MDSAAQDSRILERLFSTIESRKGADPASSYTAKLLAEGKPKIAKKLGEEATETVIAATAVLAASIFHFGTFTIAQAKAHMAEAGLPMRL